MAKIASSNLAGPILSMLERCESFGKTNQSRAQDRRDSGYLVIKPGYIGPISDAWRVEFLPNSIAARWLIGGVYVAVPILFAARICWTTRCALRFGNRVHKFGLSIVMMFVPSAIEYVVLVPGFWNVFLASLSAVGAILGLLSYRDIESPSSGNG
jgi:hypothetical protein